MTHDTTRRALLASVVGLAGCSRTSPGGHNRRAGDDVSELDTDARLDGWLSYQNDDSNRGWVAEPIPADNPPEQLWTTSVGDTDSGVVSTGRHLYVGDGSGRCFRLDGRSEWTVENSGQSGATPTLAYNRVLFTTLDSVISTDRDSGAISWNETFGNVQRSIVTHETSIALCASEGVFGVSLRDGTTEWRFEGAGQAKRGLCRSDDALFVVAGDGSKGTVYRLSMVDGTKQWEVDLSGVPVCPPVVSESSVYVVTSDMTVACLDTTNGTLDWEATTPATRTPPPAISPSLVYVASGNGDVLQALDARDGSHVWEFETGPTLAPPVATPSGVLVGTMNEGLIYVSEDGKRRWRVPSVNVRSPLCISDNKLFFKDDRSSSLRAFGWGHE